MSAAKPNDTERQLIAALRASRDRLRRLDERARPAQRPMLTLIRGGRHA